MNLFFILTKKKNSLRGRSFCTDHLETIIFCLREVFIFKYKFIIIVK
jgi:hypothetical protein